MKSDYIYVIVIFMLGCSCESRIQPSTNLLEGYILNLPKIEVSTNNINVDREKVNSLLSTIENSIPEKIVFIDHSTWSIFMAKKDGTILDIKGREGRGPGEFLGINDLYIYTEENILQVLDKKAQRLTFYKINNDNLELTHSVSLPNYGQQYLQSVFKRNGNNVGVFRVLQQYESTGIENKLYVYYLDKEFKMKEKLLEIEGSELIETNLLNGEKKYRENIFGNKTVWSFNKDKLFYSNAEDLNFEIFNIDNKTITEYKIPEIPSNINTTEVIDFMMDRYSKIFIINPEYESYFEKRIALPYFNSIYSSNNYLYIPLIKYGNEKSYILQYNIENKRMSRIETPSNFYMSGVNQTGIYGVRTDGDSEEIMISILEFQ